MKVSIREFRSKMSHYLKLTPLILTLRGVDVYTISQYKPSDVYTSPVKPVDVYTSKPDNSDIKLCKHGSPIGLCKHNCKI